MTADPSRPRSPAVLEIRNLSMSFPGVLALDRLDMRVHRGRTHALLGHNGSGKSTLIKVLAGFHRPDRGGEIRLDGVPFDPHSAALAKHSLRFVHQDLGIIDELNAIDNVALNEGYARVGRFGISDAAQARLTTELLRRFGLEFDVRRPMAKASAVERTSLAIARALAGLADGEGVLVLDEPTAALPPLQVESLFRLISDVKAKGTAVIYVSHRIGEIFDIADDVTILREGRVIAQGPVGDFTRSAVVDAIAGQRVGESRNLVSVAQPETALRVTGLSAATLDGVDLEVRRGEVLGVAGLTGSGRDELPYALAGLASPAARGVWDIGPARLTSLKARTAREHGLLLIPADRIRESVLPGMTALENFSIASLTKDRRFGGLSATRERRRWHGAMRALKMADGMRSRRVETLSGGNQQKVILGRTLALDPAILVMSEPTAGVDIGARQFFYAELRQKAADGLAIVLASSDVDDLTAVCDRVIVLDQGRVAGELAGDDVQGGAIIASMLRGAPDRNDHDEEARGLRDEPQ